MKYRCSCCGYYTLDEGGGNYDICPVCFWEDDGLQNDNPDMSGGANDMSLNDAKASYAKCGACSEKFLNCVRKPTEEEKNN